MAGEAGRAVAEAVGGECVIAGILAPHSGMDHTLCRPHFPTPVALVVVEAAAAVTVVEPGAYQRSAWEREAALKELVGEGEGLNELAGEMS